MHLRVAELSINAELREGIDEITQLDGVVLDLSGFLLGRLTRSRHVIVVLKEDAA